MTPEPAASSCSPLSPLGEDGLPWRFDNRWCSEVVVLLAVGIHTDQAFDRLPILADALEEAGCDDEVILAHCRQCREHHPECWVVRRSRRAEVVTQSQPITHPLEGYVPVPEVEVRPVPVFLKVIQWSLGILIVFAVLFGLCGGILTLSQNAWRAVKP